MNGQTHGNRLTGRSADRLGGALGLLLALVLVAGAVLPAQAFVPPEDHLFEGTASTLTPAAPVPQGTQVQAFVSGVLKASTMTAANGDYYISVPFGNKIGDPVTFKVAGVLAQESTTWQVAKLDKPFDLTISALPAVFFDVTMAASPAGWGTATDVAGLGSYAEDATVAIRAVPASGYMFVNWTSSPAVAFANVTALQTSFTMPGQDVTITANFEEDTTPPPPPPTYVLTMAASPVVGGTVTVTPVQESYLEDATVTIQAVPASGYQFSHWSVAAGTLGNANLALTTFKMPPLSLTVTAVFQLVPQQPVGGICFIATAAYGTPAAEEINILREFRDQVLLPNRAGAAFVSVYYRLSPPVAEFISRHEVLRTAVRTGLNPIVTALNSSHAWWAEVGS